MIDLADGATIPAIHLTGFTILMIVVFVVGFIVGKKF